MPYGLVFILWAALHPTIRGFLFRGLATGAGGYVGVDNPLMALNALRMAGSFLNISPTGFNTPWPHDLTDVLVVALLCLGFAGWAARRWDQSSEASTRPILWTGLLTGLLPGVLTVVSAKHWFPYYACMPAIGTSMMLALLLRRQSWFVGMAGLSVFLALGIWYRGTDLGKVTLPAEANFRVASLCYKSVERDFHRLHPQFPESARVYLSIEAPSGAGLHTHLFHGQVLRTWYRNGSVATLPAEYQDNGPWKSYLFWVTSDCHVFEVALPDLRVRTTGPRPNYASYQKVLRAYAMGAWAAGDPDRGARILEGVQEIDRSSWEFDRRLAAAFFYASGRDADGDKLLSGLRPLARSDAIGAIAAALTPELPRPGLDDAAFRAFGVSTQDTTAYASLMFYFSDGVLLRKAKRMAERILALDPTDEDAKAMLDAIAKVPEWEAVLVPAEGWGNRLDRAY